MDEELKEIIATNLNGFNYEALGAWGLMEHICNLIDMEGYVVVKKDTPHVVRCVECGLAYDLDVYSAICPHRVKEEQDEI